MFRSLMLAGAAVTLVSTASLAQTPMGAGRQPTNSVEAEAQARAAGQPGVGTPAPRTDGTPGNPPGTVVGRAIDRAAGTNTTGAYPTQSDGTRANPPGSAVGRAVEGVPHGPPGTGVINNNGG